MAEKTMPERMLLVDVTRCMACHSCEMACAVAHSTAKDLVGALAEEPKPASRVRVESAEGVAVPLQCRHCEDAPCVAICPTAALAKAGTNQPVTVDNERCIGCKFCVMICPFGVISLGKGGKAVVKCDMCVERLEAGEKPACVSACPTGALALSSLNEWLKKRRSRAAAEVSAGARKANSIRAESGNGS